MSKALDDRPGLSRGHLWNNLRCMGGKNIGRRLTWQAGPLTVSPFDLIVGIEVEHRVHYAQSSATTTAALGRVVESVVEKTTSLAGRNLGPETVAVLFHFDPVEACLRGIFCDSTFQDDATDVVVCHLRAIDKALNRIYAPLMDDDSVDESEWTAAMAVESSRIKRLVSNALSRTDLTSLPLGTVIAYSDMDRSTIPGEFQAERLRGPGIASAP